jgi:hypothetical protein
MSEPLKKFLEREFKGEKLEQILRQLIEEGGASEIEDLFYWTEDDYKGLGIKITPMRKIMIALKVNLN